MVAEQGDLEPVRPEGHDDPRVEPGQVIGVSHEGVTRQGPGRLGDRRGDQGVDPAGAGLGHGRFEGPEGDLAVLRGDAAGGGRSEGPGDGREIDPGPDRTVGRPGLRPQPHPEADFFGFDDAGRGEEDVGRRRERGRSGQRLDDDLGTDAARVAGGHPDPGDGHFSPGLPLALGGFGHLVDAADARLVDEEVRRVVAVELDAVAVVPLDVALDDLAVRIDDGHRGLLVHLLEVVIALGEGVGRRVHPLAGRFLVPFLVLAHAFLDLGEIGPDQLSVHGSLSHRWVEWVGRPFDPRISRRAPRLQVKSFGVNKEKRDPRPEGGRRGRLADGDSVGRRSGLSVQPGGEVGEVDVLRLQVRPHRPSRARPGRRCRR